MPDVFYKLAIEGVAAGQNIANILYYGQDDFSPFPAWSPDVAAQLNDAWSESVIEAWLDAMSTDYTCTQLMTTAVNERGVTVSDYGVVLNIASPGTLAQPFASPGQAAILNFTTGALYTPGLPMKRSYIAFGPVPRLYIDPNGTLSLDVDVNCVAHYASLVTVVATVTLPPIHLKTCPSPSSMRRSHEYDPAAIASVSAAESVSEISPIAAFVSMMTNSPTAVPALFLICARNA